MKAIVSYKGVDSCIPICIIDDGLTLRLKSTSSFGDSVSFKQKTLTPGSLSRDCPIYIQSALPKWRVLSCDATLFTCSRYTYKHHKGEHWLVYTTSLFRFLKNPPSEPSS